MSPLPTDEVTLTVVPTAPGPAGDGEADSGAGTDQEDQDANNLVKEERTALALPAVGSAVTFVSKNGGIR